MASLARLQSSSCANPVLDIYMQVSGVLTNVFELQFQIYDKTSGVGVQVYPATLGDRTTVVIGTDCPTGDRLSTGRYVARWTAPSNQNIGAHYIKWYFRLNSGSPEQTFIEEFEVLADVSPSIDPNANYCLVQDLRDEGYTNTTTYPDVWIQQRIGLSSRFIEAATRRFFYPKLLTIRMDGTGGPKVLLFDPIIAIEYVRQEIATYGADYSLLEADAYRVYNRHLTQQLFEPDDRNNPKIELVNPVSIRGHGGAYYPLVFPRGQQNVEIKGYFGYTDYDGTARGKTPDLIRHACKLLTKKHLGKLAVSAGSIDTSRLISERTRDQSYTLAAPNSGQVGALFTRDPDIDYVLSYYQRPPSLGAT